jgi:hypothetical protein
MRLLICGAYDFSDRTWGFDQLDTFLSRNRVSVVIAGAPRGIEIIAIEWAQSRGLEAVKYPAGLRNLAAKARNTRVLYTAKPDHVFVLTGGRSTGDLVSQAKAKGVPVTFAKGI